MVINNTATEIGDELLIYGTIPIYGIVSLNDFEDVIIGETETRFFEKKFQYSTDGIFFTEWKELNSSNLSLIQIQPNQTFFVNYIYKRAGTDTSGELSFVNVELLGDFIGYEIEVSELFKNSIFSSIDLTNVNLIEKSVNLTKKLFESGILPEYIIRNRTENSKVDDKNFIEFWRAQSTFFSLIIVLSEKIENYLDEIESLKNYLRQFDSLFDSETVELERLIEIRDSYINHNFKRGTVTVFEENGEFLLFIGKKVQDEFLFELITDENIGWNLGNSSPCYRGNNFSKQLIKTKDKTENFESLENYSISNVEMTKIVKEEDVDILVISTIYDDWYLPSKDELFEIEKIYEIGFEKGVFEPNFSLWSSTEDTATRAWRHRLSDNFIATANKTDQLKSIPIRDFTSSKIFANGDLGQAGLVFYSEEISPNLFRYYETALSMVDITVWSNVNSLIGTTLPGIGEGASNTQMIIDQSGHTISAALKSSLYPESEISSQYTGLKSEIYDSEKIIYVDENVDYEITFWIKQEQNVENINFSCKGFDSNGIQIDFKSALDDSSNNFFFENKSLIQEERWYFVRGIIYNKYFTNSSENLNIGFGNHLKFSDGIKSIHPEIYIDNNVIGSLFLKDLKIRPLVRGNSSNEYYDSEGKIRGSKSFCFANLKNVISVTAKNNNEEFGERHITEQTKKKLIPYNSILDITFLEK